MKKFFFIWCFASQFSFAQEKPQYTQYIFNTLLLNPAVSGIENYTDVKAGYRSQWTGLQGAPVTSFLTVSMPIGNKFTEGDPTGFPEATSEYDLSKTYNQNYSAAGPHHGIGLMVVSDHTGPISQTNIDATYAYHLVLATKVNLAVGVMAGLSDVSLNTAAITTEVAYDPAIANGNNSQWKPDLGAGVWLYAGDYYFGVSAQQLLPQNSFSETNNKFDQIKPTPEFFLTSGVKLPLTDDISFLPSFLVKAINPEPLAVDLNSKISFQDKFWMGVSYRVGDSFGVLAGVNINSFINVGYSYDITTSALNTVSNGTHEIVINLLLNNRHKVTCPQRQF